jgi:ribosomal protein S18 acetylase RimI-like enzyme
MNTQIVKTATQSVESRLIDTLVLAFSTDPGARWSWPDPQQYLRYFPEMVKAFAGKAFEHGSAYYNEGYFGAALWLPPDVHPDDEAMTALLRKSTSPEVQKDIFAVFEQMESYHPSEPFWYLPLLGVDPFLQGNGLGSALLKYALVRCDSEKKFAFLESTNPRNVPLYERHGFEVIGKIQKGTSPILYPMLRKPKS